MKVVNTDERFSCGTKFEVKSMRGQFGAQFQKTGGRGLVSGYDL